MKKIILIGGGGHCKACIDVIEQTNKYTIVGIIDMKELIGQKILGYPIIGCDDDILNLKSQTDYFLITIGQIGEPKQRKIILEFLKKNNCDIATIISPLAYVSEYSIIKKGTIIMHHVVVNANATIGENCIINTKALIEHDVIIGQSTHISTGAIVNGGAIIGENTFYGSGAVCKQGATIPSKSFIKANSIIK